MVAGGPVFDYRDVNKVALFSVIKYKKGAGVLEWLEQQLVPVFSDVDADTQTFILWAWQHRQESSLNLDTDIPATLRPVVSAAWEALELFHRSSSLAESLHSWLRPYLQLHRGMHKWLLPLLQLFWNHHQVEQGKWVGSSLLKLAGVQDAPSLATVLDRLFCPGTATQQA
jgi:hypothetical protein